MRFHRKPLYARGKRGEKSGFPGTGRAANRFDISRLIHCAERGEGWEQRCALAIIPLYLHFARAKERVEAADARARDNPLLPKIAKNLVQVGAALVRQIFIVD